MVLRAQENLLNFLELYKETRNVSASARTLGISRATANRWLIKARTKDGVIHETGAQETHDSRPVEKALTDLVRQHPTWSSRKYADALTNAEVTLSSRTIQRRLNKLDFGLKEQRICAVEEWIIREGGTMAFSARQELRNAGRPIDSNNSRPQYPGNILAFVAHKWLRRRTEFSYVVVAIDLYSQTVRTTLWDGSDFETPIHTYLAITEFIRRRCFLKDPMVVTDRGPFSKIGGIQFIPLFTNSPFGYSRDGTNEQYRAIDGVVSYVLALMRKEAFPALRKLANSDDIESVKKSLQEWEWNYNIGHVNFGFPNFGLTPWQVIARASQHIDNNYEQK